VECLPSCQVLQADDAKDGVGPVQLVVVGVDEEIRDTAHEGVKDLDGTVLTSEVTDTHEGGLAAVRVVELTTKHIEI